MNKKVKLQKEGAAMNAGVVNGVILSPNNSDKVQMPTPVENKHIFKIEEDEEAKEYSYNLNQPDSDDEDDDYEEEESDEEKKKHKEGSEDKSNKDSDIKENKVSAGSKASAKDESTGQSLSTTAEDELSQEDFDIQNVCHRIFTKVLSHFYF